MDPVTHAVLGRSLEYLRQRGPGEPGRGLAVVLGALSPDIDAALMPTGFDRYLAAHEIGTHSAIGAFVCGVLAAALTRAIRRGSRLTVLIAAAIVGATSHIAADLMAGAVIRVGWPLVDARVMNLGAFAMGDLYVVTISFVAALLLALDAPRRRRWATLFVALALAGGALKTWSRLRAVDVYRAAAASSSDGAMLIEPLLESIFEWRVIDRTAHEVRAWHADARGTTRLLLTIPRQPATDATATALLEQSQDWDTTRNFLRAHDFTFATVDRDAATGESWVMWSDIRYCETAASCAIRSGGAIAASGELRLLVDVGSVRQVR
jgi:membrane-bound metal-dependent hydrolase YbcI (DUF457 family)